MVRGSVGAALAVGLFFACTGSDPDVTDPDAGTSEAGTSGSTSEAGASGSTSGETRLCPSGCLPRAPEGWTGPAAVYDGPEPATLPACPDGLPIRLETFALGTTPASTCTCAPSAFTGSPKCQAELQGYDDADCTSGDDGLHSVTQTTCNQVAASTGKSYWKLLNPIVVGSGCAPATKTTQTAAIVPRRVVDKTMIACGPAAPAACSDRNDCTIAPAVQGDAGKTFARSCIYREEAQDCPSGYPSRTLITKTIDDSRSCADCSVTFKGTCGDVTAQADDMCGGAAQTGIKFGTCVDKPSFFMQSSVSCDVDSGPRGTLTAMDTFTICCAQ